MRLLSLALLALVVGCASDKGTTYTMDLTSATAPQLSLVSVVVSTRSTQVTFRYDGGDRTRRVGVHAAGQPGAFAVTDPATSQRYALKKIKGIAVLPERTTVAARASLTFTLTFDPLPATTKRIHVEEGQYTGEPDESRWAFREVVLR